MTKLLSKAAAFRHDGVGYPHLTLAVDEAPAVGAALLAAIGTYASVPEACEATIRTVSETRPTPKAVDTYLPYYKLYRCLYPALKNGYTTVANLQ